MIDRGEATCKRVRALAGRRGPETAAEIVRELDAEQREAFACATRSKLQSYARSDHERVLLSIVERWSHVAWYCERVDGDAFKMSRAWWLPLSRVGEEICDLIGGKRA